MSSPAGQERKTLQSWKEIAAFLGVTVRAVQKWEHDKSLPIHRRDRSVYAYSDELEAWLSQRDPAACNGPVPEAPGKDKLKLFTWIAIGIAATLLIATISTLWIFANQHGKPSRCEVVGTTLRVLDDKNRICGTQDFPNLDINWYEKASGFEQTQMIEDFGHNRETFVFFNVMSLPKSAEVRGKLVCLDKEAKKRWEFPLGAAKTLGSRYFSSSYHARFIRKIMVAGQDYVLVVARHEEWFPTQVAVIDPRTGTLLCSYFHPGAFYDCFVRDIDADGIDEILLCGINNPGDGLGHPAFVVLKPPFTSRNKSNKVMISSMADFTAGSEFAYLLFPRCDISDAKNSLPHFDEVMIEENNRIRLRMSAFSDSFIVYYLDFGLQVTDVRVSDALKGVHAELRRSGMLNHDLTEAEIASWGKAISFQGAPNGNSPEVEKVFGSAK